MIKLKYVNHNTPVATYNKWWMNFLDGHDVFACESPQKELRKILHNNYHAEYVPDEKCIAFETEQDVTLFLLKWS